MSFDTTLEKITIIHGGKEVVINVAYDEERDEQRGYIGDTPNYYSIEAVSRALGKADSFKREQVADLFEHPASQVRCIRPR